MALLVINNHGILAARLVQLAKEAGAKQVTVVDSSRVNVNGLDGFDKILLTSGNGLPSRAGRTIEVIKKAVPKASILGVGLGMLAIAEAFGAKVVASPKVVMAQVKKGVVSGATTRLFKGINREFEAGYYYSHQLAGRLPDGLVPTAKNKDKEVIALRHGKYDVNGILFDPASTLTPQGEVFVRNWLLG